MKQVTQIHRHRNGVSGDPFYVALIEDDENNTNPLMAIVPVTAVESGESSPQSGCYQCYVLDPKRAGEGVIAFMQNSWRGDHYFQLVVDAARAAG